MIIIIVIAIALFVIVPVAWFYLLPQLGLIPKDLEMRGKTFAVPTMRTESAGTILSTPLSQPLIADFYAVPVHPDDPETLQFLDLSRGTPNTWYWDFGDKTNATERNPVHRFSSPAGNTAISLTVTRGDGAESSKTNSDLVSAASSGPVKIQLDTNRIGAVMKGSSVSFQVNEPSSNIIINSNPITLPLGSLVKLRVNHNGEGTLATRGGQLAGVLFPDATLFVDGKQIARGSVGHINTKDPAWLSTDLNFIVSPVKGDIRQFTVNGNTLQVGEHNGYIRFRHLDLYPHSDLTVESTPGYFFGDALWYQFVPEVIADFDPATPITGGAPFNITFSDRSAGSPQAWQWDFGDGTISSEQNPRHTYRDSGTYTVKLTARNGEISDTKTKDRLVIVTIPRVEANFSAVPVSGSAPLEVRFTDQSTGSPSFWQWDFGDNSSTSISAEQNPVHTYDTQGVYSVWLGTGNIFGSSDRYQQQYIIVGDPFRSPDNTVFLRAARGGYLEEGSTLLFIIAKSPGTIYTGGIRYDLPVGTKVRLVVTTSQYGSITITGNRIERFDLNDIALYINDKFIRTGHIDSIYIPGLDQFQTTLSYYMPADTARTLYTENGYDVLTDLENHWIRVSNIGMNAHGLLSLIATKNSTYIDGAANQTVHDWIIE